MARLRVVLAEDNAPMAQQLQALLACDHDVDVVADGDALIAAVDARMPDIIITDIAMPGSSGLAVVRSILVAHPHARILFITVTDNPAVIESALALGALGYVLKCNAGEELNAAVQVAFQGRQYLSASARDALRRRQAGRA